MGVFLWLLWWQEDFRPLGRGGVQEGPSPEGLVCVAFLWNRLLTQLCLRNGAAARGTHSDL